MSNVIDEAENGISFMVLLLVVGVIAWAVWKARIFGSADGVPFFENIGRWWNELFGGLFGGDDVSPDPGSATLQDQEQALANFTMPSTQQAQTVYVETAGDLSSWFQQAQSDPAGLSLGNSPLF